MHFLNPSILIFYYTLVIKEGYDFTNSHFKDVNCGSNLPGVSQLYPDKSKTAVGVLRLKYYDFYACQKPYCPHILTGDVDHNFPFFYLHSLLELNENIFVKLLCLDLHCSSPWLFNICKCKFKMTLSEDAELNHALGHRSRLFSSTSLTPISLTVDTSATSGDPVLSINL